METVKGYVEHIVYRNKENGYTVLELTTDSDIGRNTSPCKRRRTP